MEVRKPELLAPAGEYAGLVGAIAAGADAVYLGGTRFGARAYAHNFTEEELLRGLDHAHLRGRRIYLTVNTLVKEREYRELGEMLGPLDAAGLDGVIVQDLGVFAFVRRHFPELSLHISTQAAVTGAYGALFLRSRGADRVVPARELSLAELARIHREARDEDGSIEIEAFIHGAMCYSYSGLCLFSSMLGGRSGNRGRCAGACRLPYGGAYPLSLRDMCTLPILRELILARDGAGEPVLQSLKIEGRMKDPVYTAGVTAVYRRAIDEIAEHPEREYRPSAEDMAMLRGLYLRTDLCEGYYFRHNGRDMTTGATPGYIGTDPALEEEVRRRYFATAPSRDDPQHLRTQNHDGIKDPSASGAGGACDRAEDAAPGATVQPMAEPLRYVSRAEAIPVEAELVAREGEPLALTLRLASGDGAGLAVAVRGKPVEGARKHAATKESLSGQLDRFGGSGFVLRRREIRLLGEVFVPASEVNALRRKACEDLEGLLRKRHRDRAAGWRRAVAERHGRAGADADSAERERGAAMPGERRGAASPKWCVSVETPEQLLALWASGRDVDRIYVPLRACLSWTGGEGAEARELARAWRKALSAGPAGSAEGAPEIFAALPFIQRGGEDGPAEEDVRRVLLAGETGGVPVRGALARNLEELAFLRALGYAGTVEADLGLSIWNAAAYREARALFDEWTISPELRGPEIRELLSALGEDAAREAGLIVYGRIPMMVSANCLRMSDGRCEGRGKRPGFAGTLRDRKGKVLPVAGDCRYCYNVIRNAVPTSLHRLREEVDRLPLGRRRIDLTSETGEEARLVLCGSYPAETTTGRFREGVA